MIDKLGNKIIWVLLPLACILLYFNSMRFDYAWDDQLVLLDNEVTKKGVSAIPEIWTSRSFIKERSIYRPIPQSLYAIYWEIAPNNAKLGHVISVLLYATCCLLLLFLLRKIFPKQNPWLLNFIALLFLVHPVHTEVVCNIKSWDELLSFILSISTLLLFFKWMESKQFRYALIALVLFAAAILSKVSAISLVLITPLVYYYTNNDFNLKSSIQDTWNDFFNSETLNWRHFIAVLVVLPFFLFLKYLNAAYLPIILGIALVWLTWKTKGDLKILLSYMLAAIGVFLDIPFMLGFGIGLSVPLILKKDLKAAIILAFLLAIVGTLDSIFQFKFIDLAASLVFTAITFLAVKKQWKIPIILLFILGIHGIVTVGMEGVSLFISMGLILLSLYNVEPKAPFKTVGLTLFLAFLIYNTYDYYRYNSDTNWEEQVHLRLIEKKEIDPNSFYKIHNVLAGETNLATKTATISTIQLKYLQLLTYPKTLVHQYGYNQMELTSFSNWKVWLSIVIHLALFAFMIYGLVNKKKWALGIVWYFATILIYTNIIKLMPDTLAERFLFLPSVGFCIALVFGVHRLFKLLLKDKAVVGLAVLLLPVVVLMSFKTINRSKAWKDNLTLASSTVKNAPNNAAINAQYASELRQLLNTSPDTIAKTEIEGLIETHFLKAIEIYPEFYSANADLGAFYLKQAKPDKARSHLETAAAIRPMSFINHYYLSYIYYDAKLYQKAATEFEKSLELADNNITVEEYVKSSELLARCYFYLGDLPKANEVLISTYKVYGTKGSIVLLSNMYREIGDTEAAIELLMLLLADFPNDQSIMDAILTLQTL